MSQDWKKIYAPKQSVPSLDDLGYSSIAMDHFINPRNVGRLKDYHGLGKFGDPSCGDSLEITIKINNKDLITDIGYLVYGCAGAIATTSMVSVLAKGCDISSALKILKQDVIDALGGFPKEKIHCSLMGLEGLRIALADALFGRELIEKGKVKDFDQYRALRQEGKIRFEFRPVEEMGESK